MIVRIVKLTFHKENIHTFLDIFEQSKQKIRASEGCSLVELYQDEKNESIFFTYSYWTDETFLDLYRQSDFFKSVWAKTKILFSEKPEAWSVNKLDTLA